MSDAEAVARLTASLEGRYAIERELGVGGMATVYLARDVKHDRFVALKVLRPELSAALGAERFHAEIRVTARLAHPNILALYDSGEAAGLLYYVMPFVQGETLRAKLTREGRLSVDNALRITRAVAEALAHAHGREVVHRDIKPENILLQNGHPFVADFGIARAVGAAGSDRLTMTGLLMGTPLYMSPEQASGDSVIDGRSDVYSLACVLFEMLTGEAPFTGATMQSVIAKRFSEPAPSAAVKRAELAGPIDAALKRALARDPGERIESATRFAEILGSVQGAAHATTGSIAGSKLDVPPCIAVLPFSNMSADPEAEFFSDGMSEEILNALAKLGGLRVIARTSSFAFKGKNVDVRDIGRALGATYVLEGSIRKSGNRLRITAQLIDAGSGHHLWSERYDREMTDVFALQDEITATIRDELSKRIVGIGEAVARPTPDIDAETYELWLRGWHFVERRIEGMRRGMEILREVTARAPQFAPGHSALASVHTVQGFYCLLPSADALRVARESAARALSIDPDEAQALVILGHAALFLDWDWPAAEVHYERARTLGHTTPGTWAATAGIFYHLSLGRFDIARDRARKGIAIDPLNPSRASMEANVEIMARNYDAAVSACDRIIDFAPGFSEAHRFRGLALLRSGRHDEGLRALEDAARLSRRHVWAVANLAQAYNLNGRLPDADAIVTELETRAASEHVPPTARLYAHMFSSRANPDSAFALLNEAINARDFWVVMTSVEYWPDWMLADSRLDDAIRRIGIPVPA